MAEHITKGSTNGQKDTFPTGAQRDSEMGKPLFHLIPFKLLLELNERIGGGELLINRDSPAIHTAGSDQRHDLIPQLALDRLAALYGRGAKKYNDNNWQKGINFVRTFGSLLRHALQWYWGDTSEDHLAAVIWNAITLMWLEAKIAEGERPAYLDDRSFAKTRVSYIFETAKKVSPMDEKWEIQKGDLDGWLSLEQAQCKLDCQLPHKVIVKNVTHWLDKP